MKGYLLLSDGTKFHGTVIGAHENAIGELVFNTGMTGYQEIVTDPSYCGQIVVLTYPMIGNYGISNVDQSEKVQAKGLVVKDLAALESNWSSTGSFEDYLINQKLVAIKGIDTRHLTHIIREKGNVTAQIVHEGQKDLDWNYDRINPVLEVTTKEIYQLGNGSMHIAVMDYGIKKSILNQLLLKDFKISVCPATTSAEEVLQLNPDGIFLSNGPGDPSELTSMINEVKIMSDQKPTFGICLGHQLLAHAYGCKTRKLKFGHRGPNHPVKDITLDRVFITSQNHGYMIDESSLNKEVLTVTHLNVNDETIEGMKHNSKPIFSVQYHPEAAPGPDDSNYLFDTFEKMVKEALC